MSDTKAAGQRRPASFLVVLLLGIWIGAARTAGADETSSGAAAPGASGQEIAVAPGGATPGDRDQVKSQPGKWEVIAYPYFWLPWVDSTVSADGVSSTLILDPSDILKALNFGLLGGIEVRRDRWFGGLDLMYMNLGVDSEAGPVFTPVGPFTVTRGPAVITIPSQTAVIGPLDVDVKLTLFIARGIFGYRLLSRPMSDLFGNARPGDKRRFDLDVYAGGRSWLLRTQVDVDGPPISLPGTTGTISFPSRPSIMLPGIQIPAESGGRIDIRERATTWWVDPLVGARIRADLTDRVLVRVGGNVGGFGAGSASEFTWEAMSTFGLRFKERWTAEAGYRALAVKRETGGVQAEMIQHGPVMGFTYRF